MHKCVGQKDIKTCGSKVLDNKDEQRKERHLFVVRADEVENKTPVHERKQIIEEEGQTAI